MYWPTTMQRAAKQCIETPSPEKRAQELLDEIVNEYSNKPTGVSFMLDVAATLISDMLSSSKFSFAVDTLITTILKLTMFSSENAQKMTTAHYCFLEALACRFVL